MVQLKANSTDKKSEYTDLIDQFLSSQGIQESVADPTTSPKFKSTMVPFGIDSPGSDNKENEASPSTLNKRVRKILERVGPLPNDREELLLFGETSPQRIKRTRKAKESKSFCKVCKESIAKEGQKSQGPRRHIMQHHMKRPIFRCPLCSHFSFYDKGHINSHLRRRHEATDLQCIEMDKLEFAREERLWNEVCFGKDSTGEISSELERLRLMNREYEAVQQGQVIQEVQAPVFSVEKFIAPTMVPAISQLQMPNLVNYVPLLQNLLAIAQGQQPHSGQKIGHF